MYHLNRVTAAAAVLSVAATAQTVVLDGSTALHTYDGHGALSAGASSRLLWDYPEPQRSQILDYLFKPQFGASLHLLKVEIGGDCQSTDGTEPSHMHNATDLNCERGYEFWLLQQAKQRNPDIKTYALSWGVPYWIGNGSFFTPDNWMYQTQFLTCVRETLGFDVDYIGIWNERSWGSGDYVIGLRNTLDAAGFNATQIILPDGGDDKGPLHLAEANATFKDAIGGVGLHYPCNHPDPDIQLNISKKYWASEDYSTVANWAGGGCWGRLLVQNYVRMNMTSTISWSLIWAVYGNLPYFGNGLMYSMEPWSGHYDVMSPIWTSAHWTQFTSPGWRFLHVPGGGSGNLPNGGSYVTLVPPSSLSDFTVILESLQGACLRCAGATTSNQTVTFRTSGGLPGAGTVLHVWMTTPAAWFVQQPDVTIAADGTFSVFLPADAMVTVSTVGGATHGTFAEPVPASAPFPLPYADNFDNYTWDMLPHYFSDQGGSFAVRNGVMVQVVTRDPGPNAWVSDPDPTTLIGDVTWTNYNVSADVSIPVAAVQAHMQSLADSNTPASLLPCDASAPATQRWTFDVPAASFLSLTANGQQICLNLDGCATDVIYFECVTTGSTCCGNDCYENEQWSWGAGALSDHLTSPLLPNACLTVGAAGNISMQTCDASSAAQKWSYNASSGQLSLTGSGRCLSLPPPLTYAQLCGRISSYSGFGNAPVPGYCARLGGDGTWALQQHGTNLSAGVLPAFVPTATHALALSMQGSSIGMSVNGTTLATVTDTAYTAGMAAVGSGYHFAAFDNFAVTA